MTKPRTPHTWAAAVTRIADRLGWDGAARAVRKSVALVRAWSDPATGKRPSLDQVLALSVAYAAAGGEDAPFVDALAFQIGTTVADRDPCRRALVVQAGTAAREVGEAIASALTIALPGSSPLDAMRAFAETKEASEHVDTLLALLASFLPSHARDDAGKSGDEQP